MLRETTMPTIAAETNIPATIRTISPGQTVDCLGSVVLA